MKIAICLIIISCYFTLITAKCPSPAVISPCTCHTSSENETYMICGGHENYNLRNIFVSLSNVLTNDEKHLKQIYLNNTAINELVMNVFYDITFETVYIADAYNLTKVNTLAFTPTTSYVKNLIIYTAPIGGNVSAEYNIFNAINTLSNVEYVFIYNTSLTSIPANAFSVLNKLHELYFGRNVALKSLGNNAFYELNNLTRLTFEANSLAYIPEHGLSFRNRTNITLDVYFDKTNLTTNSFSNATFTTIRRPFRLHISYALQLKYLDENIFDTFLSNGNQLYLFGTPLECDCRMYWLYANRAQYESLVDSAQCADGYSVFNQTHAYSTCIVSSARKLFI